MTLEEGVKGGQDKNKGQKKMHRATRDQKRDKMRWEGGLKNRILVTMSVMMR